MAAYNSDRQYSRRLDGFRGVDLSGADSRVDVRRFAYLKNMYKDYSAECGDAVETVPGYRRLAGLTGRVWGIWQRLEENGLYMLVHAGTHLYTFPHTDRDALGEPGALTVFNGLADAPSTAFVFNGRFWLLDGGGGYFVLNGGVLSPVTDAPYLPVTYINGEQYEQRNLLCNRTVNRDTHMAEFAFDEIVKREAKRLTLTAGDMTLTRTEGERNIIAGWREGYSADTLFAAGHYAGSFPALTPADWSDAVRHIAVDAFKNDLSLKRLFIGKVNVRAGAFSGCTALRELHIHGSSRIGDNTGSWYAPVAQDADGYGIAPTAFSGCTGLKRVFALRWLNLDSLLPDSAGVEELWLEDMPPCYVTQEENPDYSPPADPSDPGEEPQEGDTPGDGGGDPDVNTADEYINVTHSVISNFTALKVIYTSKSEAEWGAIPGIGDLTLPAGCVIMYGTSAPSVFDTDPEDDTSVLHTYRQAVCYDPADSVESVGAGGEPTEDYGIVWRTVDGKRYVDRVITTRDWRDRDVDITLNCKPSEFRRASDGTELPASLPPTDFAAANPGYTGTAQAAVCGCTLSAVFDGRVFLSGNPALPNTVFYTARDLTGAANPAYFGMLNYVNDGTGTTHNRALLAAAGTLMVFKGDDPQEATVYYHTGADTETNVLPRIYPSERGVSGAGCTGAACNFLDDIVFLSRRGLEAVNRQTPELERTLGHRSSYVDRALCAEALEGAFFCEWEGYLAVFCPSGRVYLADSRQVCTGPAGDTEYEWYCMEDIGDCSDRAELYRLTTGDVRVSVPSAGSYWLSQREAWCVCGGERRRLRLAGSTEGLVRYSQVYSSYLYTTESGNAVYYTDGDTPGQMLAAVAEYEDGEVYLVEPSGLFAGTVTSPPTAAAYAAGSLYFGTDNGALFCFNSDLRGIPFEGDDPGRGCLHARHYTFDGRMIDAALAAAYEDAGFPDLAKKTVKKSLTVHAKAFDNARVTVSVRTDRSGVWRQVGVISAASYQFEEADFGNASLQLSDDSITVVREKEKKWARKQLFFRSVSASPWGIYHIGYRFIIKGRIKV